MAKLKINNSSISAIVDDEDYEMLKLFPWSFNPNGYIRTTVYLPDKKMTIRLHRIIINAPKEMSVDHINHNKLDNRKQNLRVCTHQQNHMNRKPDKNTSSKFKGVSFIKKNKNWVAYIYFGENRYHLGTFKREITAAQAYNFKAKELFGSFARFNPV